MRFAAILFTFLLAGTSAFAAPNWKEFGRSPIFKSEIDINSIKQRTINGGLEVQSQLRLTLFYETEAKSKKGPFYFGAGSFYISDLTVVCKDDVMVLNTVTLYTKNGEVIDSDQPIGPIKNPRDEDSFVSAWIAHVCGAKTGKLEPYV